MKKIKANFIQWILLLAILIGNAGIFISCGDDDEAPVIEIAKIKLDQTEASVLTGEKLQLIATIEPLEATEINIKWSSSNEHIATVDERGLVTTIKQGVCDIIASTEEGISSKCELAVNDYVKLERIEWANPWEFMFDEELKPFLVNCYPENATNQGYTLEVDDPNTICIQGGKIWAVDYGKTIIRVTSVEDPSIKLVIPMEVIRKRNEDGFRISPKITICPIHRGYSKRAVFVDFFRDYSTANGELPLLQWTSSDPSKIDFTKKEDGHVDITATGCVHLELGSNAREGDKVTITATDKTGFQSECEVTVTYKDDYVPTESITCMGNIRVAVGETAQADSRATPENGSNTKILYFSSNEEIFTVDDKGVVTAKKAGLAQLTMFGEDSGWVSRTDVIVN